MAQQGLLVHVLCCLIWEGTSPSSLTVRGGEGGDTVGLVRGKGQRLQRAGVGGADGREAVRLKQK